MAAAGAPPGRDPAAPLPLLEVARLTCRYGALTAVRDVSFAVHAGEVLGLLGPNGAGKSTTMQALCGLRAPSAGSVTLAGRDLETHPRAAKRHLGYLPERPPLYDEMRVGEYLHFCARLRGVPPARRPGRVARVIDACNLAAVASRILGRLSQGMRQRVGIAQALVHEPDLVVLDEPTIGLDPIQVRELRALIRDLGRERAVVLSTHLLPEVRETCDRVLILHRGRVVLEAPMAELGAGGGRRALRVAFRRPPPGSALAALAGVEAAEARGPGEYHLGCTDADLAAESVVRGSADGGWGLALLREEGSRLEETFVALTCSDEAAPET